MLDGPGAGAEGDEEPVRARGEERGGGSEQDAPGAFTGSCGVAGECWRGGGGGVGRAIWDGRLESGVRSLSMRSREGNSEAKA